MSRMACAIFVLLGASSAVHARQGLQATIDNDAGFSDRFYTSGVRFSFHDQGLAAPFNPASYPGKLLEKWILPTSGHSYLLTGLHTYTPQHIDKAVVAYGDRPYASWAFLGAGHHQNNGRRFFTSELQAGTSGVLSREAQTYIHTDSRYSRPPNGWDHQLPERGGAQLDFRYEERFTRRAGRAAVFLFSHSRLGSMYNDIRLGPLIQLGLTGEAHSLSTDALFEQMSNGSGYAFLFFRPSVRYVAHDSTLEGFYGSSGRSTYRENELAQQIAFARLTEHNNRSALQRADAYDRLILGRNHVDYRENFLIFNDTFYGGSRSDIGMQLLIYETLFRETRPFEKKEETDALILVSLMQEPQPGNAENAFFLSQTLLRPRGKSLHPLARWIAYDKLTRDRPISTMDRALIYAFLFRGHEYGHKSYTVPVRRIMGEAETGFVFGNQSLRGQFSWTLQSKQFESARGIANFHSFFRFSASVLF